MKENVTTKGKVRLIVTPETLASDLKACKDAFESVNIPWVIMGGIVLGYARDKSIMPWDTDLDMGCFVPVKVGKWDKLRKALFEVGFKFGKSKSDFVCGRRESPFNMWFFHKRGNFYEAFPNTTPKIKFVEKAIWYDEPQMVEFLGDEYPMPNYMEDYLNCQFGEDWRINIVKDHEEYFTEKRGGRKVGMWADGPSGKDGPWWPKTIRREDSMEDDNEI